LSDFTYLPSLFQKRGVGGELERKLERKRGDGGELEEGKGVS